MTIIRHPAWQEWEAEHPNTTIIPWQPGDKRKHFQVDKQVAWDWEVALWMHVHGYGDEVTAEQMGILTRSYPVRFDSGDVGTFFEDLPWYRYELPISHIGVLDIDEERLEVNPEINPLDLIAYYEKTKVTQQVVLNGSH